MRAYDRLQVPARELGIDSSLGIPVVEVTSPEQDASYGAGSEITIDIRCVAFALVVCTMYGAVTVCMNYLK